MQWLCSVPSCEKRAWTKGYCHAHYRSDLKYGDPLALEKNKIEREKARLEKIALKEKERKKKAKKSSEVKICKVEGCEKKCVGKGYCSSHYYSFTTYGNPLTVEQRKS